MRHPTGLEVETSFTEDTPAPGTKSFGKMSSSRKSARSKAWPTARYSPYGRPPPAVSTVADQPSSPSPLTASTGPLSLSSSMESLGLSGPISCRTRGSRLRGPRFNRLPTSLASLDPDASLNRDLLAMVGADLACERVPPPAVGTKLVGRACASKRLAPLEGASAGLRDGFSATADLALAGLDSL